jgi:hypothetical protein
MSGRIFLNRIAKRLTFAALTASGLGLLGGGIWLYSRYARGLRARGLDGAALLMLIMIGVFALVLPLHLHARWTRLTARDMVREFVVRGGLMLAASAGIVFVLLLLIALVTLPARLGHPSLVLLWLTLLVPVFMVGVDLYRHTYAPTLSNFGLGFLLYAFRIYGMLAIQFTLISLAFALFPAGFLLQIFSIADLLVRRGERPWLCGSVNLQPPTCTPALVGFHIGHLLMAAAALRYGPTLFDRAAEAYHGVIAWLAQHLKET